MTPVQTIIALALLKIAGIIFFCSAFCRLVDWIRDKAIQRIERKRG